MSSVASPFPKKFKFSIKADFSMASEDTYDSYSSKNSTSWNIDYQSAPLMSDTYTNDDIAKAATWPEGARADAAKELRVDRMGSYITYDGNAGKWTIVPAKYYTLSHDKAFVIKGIGANTGQFINQYGAYIFQGSGATGSELTPTSTITVGDKKIKNIGYMYHEGASGASGASGETSLGQRKYGTWYHMNVTNNQAVDTNNPIAVTLADWSAQPNRAAYPCFGCIPVGYPGAAGAKVIIPEGKLTSSGSPTYTAGFFGGATDLSVGTANESSSSKGNPDYNRSSPILMSAYYDFHYFYSYFNFTMYWVDANYNVMRFPLLTDPFWSSYSIFKRSMLNSKWSSDLTARWPRADNFSLDDTYYITNIIPVDYFNTENYPLDWWLDDYDNGNFMYYLYAPFDVFMSLFSRPFKNPFSTPSSAFCEGIYKANKEAYLRNPYRLVIGPDYNYGRFIFDIDPETGFPEKTGRMMKIKPVANGGEIGDICAPRGIGVAWTWDDDGQLSVETSNCYQNPDFESEDPCACSSGSVTIGGSATIEYEIA
jgi:hypothetical protein